MKKLLLSSLIVITTLLAMCGCEQKSTEIENNVESKTTETSSSAINTKAMEKYGDLKTFESETLNGEKFNQDNFKKYDLTVVNFWGTYCKPCVQELPELSKIKESLPENINFIGICADSEGNEDLAKNIITKTKSKMTHLKCNESINKAIAKNIQYLPMTVIFDKDGNIVGEIMSGAPMEVAKEYTKAINNALKAIGKKTVIIESSTTESSTTNENSSDGENDINETTATNEQTSNIDDDCST